MFTWLMSVLVICFLFKGHLIPLGVFRYNQQKKIIEIFAIIVDRFKDETNVRHNKEVNDNLFLKKIYAAD